MQVKLIVIFLSIYCKKSCNFLVLETHNICTNNLLYTEGNISLLISILVHNFTN